MSNEYTEVYCPDCGHEQAEDVEENETFQCENCSCVFDEDGNTY